jgi:DNA-binding NarL/FixJ family response regulator
MAWPTNALIVDDEAHVRALVRLLLKELGITHVWEAADGQSAVDMTVQVKPELVMLDINLPILSGLKALAQLRDLEPDIPVIMMTSQTALGAVQEAARLGAAGYVLKHVPKKDAVAALREVLDALESGEPPDAE